MALSPSAILSYPRADMTAICAGVHGNAPFYGVFHVGKISRANQPEPGKGNTLFVILA